jgi:hypothetical protein
VSALHNLHVFPIVDDVGNNHVTNDADQEEEIGSELVAGSNAAVSGPQIEPTSDDRRPSAGTAPVREYSGAGVLEMLADSQLEVVSVTVVLAGGRWTITRDE